MPIRPRSSIAEASRLFAMQKNCPRPEENCSEAFEDYRDAMMVYNKSPDAEPCPDAIDAATGCDMEKDEGKAILHVLENFSRQRKTFQNFSKSLISNGNLTENLEHLIFGTDQNLGF